MISLISWHDILDIWQHNLWPNRVSDIESNSSMVYLNGFDIKNMSYESTFFGFYLDKKLVGVNSGHKCSDDSYRSRGLWVDENYRRNGIGKSLLLATIDRAIVENSKFIWSFPRKTSWSTYNSVGFQLSSKWLKSETSEANAYCFKKL